MGRQGAITFESNGLFVFMHGKRNRFLVPGLLRDIRGYQAMYRDFATSIASGRRPEMSLERAIDDQRLMDRIYANVG
jgi:predicted dehydrogenase